MGAIVLVIGLIVIGTAVIGVVVFATTRSQRNSSNGASFAGTYPQHMGYPPQQAMPPTAQQPYGTPHQGYPAPSAQSPEYPNPYTQQPPQQGQ